MNDEPDCQYKDKCTQKGYLCDTCKNNRGKKSYYESDSSYTPYIPYPYYPYPTEPIKITWDSTSSKTSEDDKK